MFKSYEAPTSTHTLPANFYQDAARGVVKMAQAFGVTVQDQIDAAVWYAIARTLQGITEKDYDFG